MFPFAGVFRRSTPRKHVSDWSRDEIKTAVLAIYQHFEATGKVQHYRTAFLVHYDRRLLPPNVPKGWAAPDPPTQPPRFKVYRIEIGGEKGADSLDQRLHDSLEAARAECVEWTGEAREVDWSALSTMATAEFFAAVRNPKVAEIYNSLGSDEP